MAKSKQLQETISLGKKLVKELSNSNRCDLTVRWMAYYIADLISRAEKEKSPVQKRALEKECADTIIELWKHREYLPERARPLSNLQPVLSVLSGLKENDKEVLPWRKFEQFQDSGPWGEFIHRMRNSMDTLLMLSVCSAVTKKSLLKEKEWLEYSSHLSEAEKNIIQLIDHLLEKEDGRFKVVFYSGDELYTNEEAKKKLSKKDQIFNKLESILKDQSEYLDELKNKLQAKHHR